MFASQVSTTEQDLLGLCGETVQQSLSFERANDSKADRPSHKPAQMDKEEQPRCRHKVDSKRVSCHAEHGSEMIKGSGLPGALAKLFQLACGKDALGRCKEGLALEAASAIGDMIGVKSVAQPIQFKPIPGISVGCGHKRQ